MQPIPDTLRMFGSVQDAEALPWTWVEEQLQSADTYWVAARGEGPPHPRPVWGTWADDGLHLSIGSPVVRRQVAADPTVTVHLDSGVDVVIVEGTAGVEDPSSMGPQVEAYNSKYDWDYDVAQYGPFTRVAPSAVLAWRSAGPAGRDGWSQIGRWRFS
jgi:hypothetical protein